MWLTDVIWNVQSGVAIGKQGPLGSIFYCTFLRISAMLLEAIT
jgi:hypothetical protein